MPVTAIGAMNGDKPNWTLAAYAAYVGIIGHDRVLVSFASAHFINGAIKENQKLSIRIVDEEMLPEVDVSGFVSGANTGKSARFDDELGANGTSIISKTRLTLECSVADVYYTKGFESIIGTMEATYVEESHLNEQEKINYHALKPVLFEFPT